MSHASIALCCSFVNAFPLKHHLTGGTCSDIKQRSSWSICSLVSYFFLQGQVSIAVFQTVWLAYFQHLFRLYTSPQMSGNFLVYMVINGNRVPTKMHKGNVFINRAIPLGLFMTCCSKIRILAANSFLPYERILLQLSPYWILFYHKAHYIVDSR